jgi:hypothetical protein
MPDEQTWDMVTRVRDSGLRCLEVPDPSDRSSGLGLALRALAITTQGNKHGFCSLWGWEVSQRRCFVLLGR